MKLKAGVSKEWLLSKNMTSSRPCAEQQAQPRKKKKNRNMKEYM